MHATQVDCGADAASVYYDDHDDQRSSLEASDRDSLATDNYSAVLTERSTISTGGESLDTQDSFVWRRPQGGNAHAAENAHR